MYFMISSTHNITLFLGIQDFLKPLFIYSEKSIFCQTDFESCMIGIMKMCSQNMFHITTNIKTYLSSIPYFCNHTDCYTNGLSIYL